MGEINSEKMAQLVCFLIHVNVIFSTPRMSFEAENMTPLEDPIQVYISEHPNSTVPEWDMPYITELDSNPFQSDLAQVKEDLATRIADLKVEGTKLRTSIEDSTGVTQIQISSLKTQVFEKIHEVQSQVSDAQCVATREVQSQVSDVQCVGTREVQSQVSDAQCVRTREVQSQVSDAECVGTCEVQSHVSDAQCVGTREVQSQVSDAQCV